MLLQRYGLLIALIVIVAIFCLLRPSTYATWQNFSSILTGDAALTLISLGIMLPLVVQQYDLSIGYIATTSSLFTVGVMSRNEWPIGAAIALGLFIGVLCGVINGILIAFTKLNSLVVTLGLGSILAGITLIYSGGRIISGGVPKAFTMLGQARPAGIPIAFIYAIILAAMVWYWLSYRVSGRHLYAIGGNEDAARLSGIPVKWLTFLALVGGALLASAGGIIQAARIGASSADSMVSMLLPAFAAAFLSTTAIRPGSFNVWGTVIAVYLVAAGTSGMFMIGAPTYVEPLFNGVILIGAIGLYRWTMYRRDKASG
jgi:ribose transport system permease protein